HKLFSIRRDRCSSRARKYAVGRRLRARHPASSTGERLLGSPLDFRAHPFLRDAQDPQIALSEAPRTSFSTARLKIEVSLGQIGFVKAYGIALSQIFEQTRRKGLAGLSLVVGGMPAHSEGFGHEQEGTCLSTLGAPRSIGRYFDRRICVKDVVSI